MEGMPQKRRSAAAEGKAADFDFARETPVLDNQEKIAAIDVKIKALMDRMREGSKFRERMTNPNIIAVAEKAENDINAEIAQLEQEKAALAEARA
ncbi:TPA: hypothetical protein DIV48_00955 [Candidatus Kaiserbacteria bacterium]|nr:MAG: hypothetical protein UY93_C0002G0470 [Parcubacteria group bacterium GW2011_GWA1_56_13]KKW46646.1 MAG: hypothetical protein UY97_C0004G0035 [Parcubacteria group bacterium GW2011_GWB1_57_6]HCR52200.1 hypothetical protein [Candidatus Kaiserbacteria bacterium]